MSSQVLSVLIQGRNDTRAAFADVQKDAKLTAEQIKELFNASAGDRARMLADLDKTSDAMRGLDQSTQKAGDSTEKWTDKQQRAAMAMEGVHDKALKLNQAMDDGQHHGEDFGNELLKMVGLGAALGGGMELAAHAIEFLKEATVGSVETFVEFGTNLDRLHEKLNVPLETAAAWEQSAAATDVSAQQIVSSLAMMDQRLEEGNKKAIGAVNDLGISLQELRDASPDKQIDLLVEGFSHLEEKGLKADVVIKQLMGRGGLGNLSVLTADAEALRHEIEQINGPLDEQVKTAKEYEHQSALLAANWAAVRRTVTAPLVGGLADMLARVNRAGPVALFAPWWGDKPNSAGGGDKGARNSWSAENPVETVTITATDADIEREQKRHEAEVKRYWDDMLSGLKAHNAEVARRLDAHAKVEADEATARIRIEKIFQETVDAIYKQEEADEREYVAQVRAARSQLLQDGRDFMRSWKQHAREMADEMLALPSDIADLVHQIGDAIGGTFGSILDNVTGVFQNFVSRVKDGFFDIVEMAQTAVDIVQGGYSIGKKVRSPGKGALAGAASGAATGALIGSVVPGIGTAAGAVIGGVLGGVGGFLGGKKGQAEQRAAMEEMRKQLVQQYGSMDALRHMASQLGVDISKAFTTRDPQIFQSTLERLNQAMADQQRRLQGIQTAMQGLGLMAQGLTATMETHGTATEADAAAFQRLGDYAAATFGAMVRENGDVIGALQQMEPILSQLAGDMDQFGVSGSSALQELLGLRQIVVDNAGIAQSIQGLNLLMKGLGDAGITTSGLFQGFGKDLAADFGALKDKGGDANQALILMQPSLQKLWEHQQKFHDITDEATLALLHEAETNGIVGEDQKSTFDKILDVLKDIRDFIIPDKSFNINGHYNGPLNTDGTPDGDGDPSTPLAKGFEGWVTRPQHFLVGERGPEYMSVTPAAKMPAGGSGSGGGGSVHVGEVHIHAAPGDSGEDLWEKFAEAIERGGAGRAVTALSNRGFLRR